ncbi:MAG: HDOD domain-containing protein [Candidatus Thiodiazotropha sp. (ex Myrtea spinifera)]|nr:HDOD domain-containing protein [Candidatus Thiodiazotropha sp. (ex Myrtea spinifera)]MCU7830415.1 HDOD domain-containing protein [Candidatus Thiodiazotropha sp. (ex Myrtea sp. 'scaly one' KF741663)]
MTQAAHEWVRRLSGEPLPVLQRTLTHVRDLLNKSSVNHGRLSESISRDPGFSLYILQKLNELPNAPKEPINKISLAIPLLGMDLIEKAARTLPCLEDKLKGPPRRGLIDCYSRGAHAAFYADAIGTRRGDRETGSLYTAALLHDISEMALWSQSTEKMLEIRQKIAQGEDHDDAAMAVLGCTFEELSLQLSEKWHLPELIQTAQGLSNSFQPRPLSVMLASAIARESSRGWQSTSTLDDIELLAEFIDIPIDSAVTWVHRLSADAARTLSVLPIPLPAFYLISGDPQQPKASTADQTRETTAATVEKKAVKPEAAPKAQPENKTPKKQANPLQQAISRALDEMLQELGLQRATFAMLNADKTQLKARLVAEEPTERSLRGFDIDLTQPTLFSLLMKKSQVIALTPGNFEKYSSMIPPQLATLINPKGFLAMSVFLHNKPVGLFYADNGSDSKITPHQYNNFKAICQRTIASLS